MMISKAPQKSLQFLVIGRLQNRCGVVLFSSSFFGNPFFLFCRPVKYVIHAVIGTRPNSPYTEYGGSERPHKSGKRSYPYVKKSFKTQHSRFAISPEILAAIGHHFIAKSFFTFFKSASLRRRMRRPETRYFFKILLGLMQCCILLPDISDFDLQIQTL